MSFSKIFKLLILIISKTYGSNSDLDRLINSLSLWIIPGMKGVIMRYKLTTINLDYLYKTKEEKNMAGSRHSGEGSKLWVSKKKKKLLTQCPLSVLIDFCPVYSEFLTVWGISDLGLTLPHIEFLSLYLDNVWSKLKLFAQKMKILIKHM